MKLTDRLALIKAGYSLKDIKAFEEEEAKAVEDEKKAEEQKQPEPNNEKKEEEPDYKKLYEELQQKFTTANETLNELQKENREKDNGATVPDPIEAFKKLFE